MVDTFLQDQITVIETAITAYTNALVALGDGILSYTLDTGQTRQTVTKADIGTINKTLDSLYNRRDIFMQRTGATCSTIRVRPSF